MFWGHFAASGSGKLKTVSGWNNGGGLTPKFQTHIRSCFEMDEPG